MGFLLSWLVLAIAFWLTAAILPGVKLKSFGSAILVAAIFAVFNFFLGWLFYTVFAIASLGLALLFSTITRWFISAIMLKITDAVTDRLEIDGFLWALGAAGLISLFGALGDWTLKSLGWM